MVFAVQSLDLHGLIFYVIALRPYWGALCALAAGVVVSAFLVVAFKRYIAPKELAEAADLQAVAVPT
jgi:PTS system fructose-specific IIC component